MADLRVSALWCFPLKMRRTLQYRSTMAMSCKVVKSHARLMKARLTTGAGTRS